jgi:hypothetical protein
MRVPRLLSLLGLSLASALVVAACSDDDPSPTEAFAEDYCALLMPCCKEAGLSNDPSSCEMLIGWAATQGKFNESKANECLAAMRAASTDPNFCSMSDGVYEDSDACDDVFDSQGGSTQPGGTCEMDSDCAGSAQGEGACMSYYEGDVRRTVCMIMADGNPGDGPCVATKDGNVTWYSPGEDPPPALGYICDQGKGTYCDDSTTKCEALVAVGSPCTYGTPCVEGAYCSSGTCQPSLPAGSACTSDDECGEKHYCDEFCKAQLPAGSPCTSSDQCDGGWCTNNKCDGSDDIGLAFVCGE